MKKLYLLLSLAILTQPDLLLAKGKNDEDRGNDRPYAQERDDRYNKRGDRRQDDRDYRRERGDDREHRRERRDDRRGDRRDDGNRYQQDGRYPQDDRYQQNYEQGDVRGGKGLPPGLAKKAAAGKPLPPGWQKKLAPGQPMDPELTRYGRPLSDNMYPNRPQTQVGSTLLQLEDKVVRVNNATNTIMEVLDAPIRTRR